MKKAYWAGAALILAFLVLGLTTFSSTMTPYVTFAEAEKCVRVVQVMGGLEKGSSRYDTVSKTLHFNLVDLETKPPILWIHGTADAIVSDTSFYDLNYLGQLGIVPGWPGADAAPAQEMVSQTRDVLEHADPRQP